MIRLQTDELSHIQQFLIDDFSFSELKDIAFDMGLDCENFPLDSKNAFAGAMLSYVQQYHNLSCLLVYMEKQRGHPEVAQVLNRLPTCQPRKKVELVLRDLSLHGLDRMQLKGSLAHLLNLKVEEVGLLSVAPVGVIFLISLPKDAAAKLAECNIFDLNIAGYSVEAVHPYETLSSFQKNQWHELVRSSQAKLAFSESVQPVAEQITQSQEVDRSAQLLQTGQGRAAMRRLLGLPLSKPGVALLGLTLLLVLIGAVVLLVINLLNPSQPPEVTPTSLPAATATPIPTTEVSTTVSVSPPTVAPEPVTPPLPITPSFTPSRLPPNLAIDPPLSDRKFDDKPFAVPVHSSSDATIQFSASGSCSISLNGTLTITGAGSCTVIVRQAETMNYKAAEVSQTFTVGKAIATIKLSNLSQQYDGKPKEVSYTVVPNLADAKVIITYSGSISAPVEPGDYTVTGTVQDKNYSGSASGKLTITKIKVQITFKGVFDRFGNLSTTYDKTQKSVEVLTNHPEIGLSLTYNPNPPINAGTYVVVATVNSAHYEGTATVNLINNKAPTTVTLQKYAGGTLVYPVNYTTTPAELHDKVIITRSERPIGPDTEVTIKAVLEESQNYKGSSDQGTYTRVG